jgi:hypothetical protein
MHRVSVVSGTYSSAMPSEPGIGDVATPDRRWSYSAVVREPA